MTSEVWALFRSLTLMSGSHTPKAALFAELRSLFQENSPCTIACGLLLSKDKTQKPHLLDTHRHMSSVSLPPIQASCTCCSERRSISLLCTAPDGMTARFPWTVWHSCSASCQDTFMSGKGTYRHMPFTSVPGHPHVPSNNNIKNHHALMSKTCEMHSYWQWSTAQGHSEPLWPAWPLCTHLNFMETFSKAQDILWSKLDPHCTKPLIPSSRLTQERKPVHELNGRNKSTPNESSVTIPHHPLCCVKIVSFSFWLFPYEDDIIMHRKYSPG